MLPKTAKDTKDSQSRLDFFLMHGNISNVNNMTKTSDGMNGWNKWFRLDIGNLWKLAFFSIPKVIETLFIESLDGCAGDIVARSDVECYREQLYEFINSNLIDQSIRITLEPSGLKIHTQSHNPTKYHPRFQLLCSPDTGWNPTTSECRFQL